MHGNHAFRELAVDHRRLRESGGASALLGSMSEVWYESCPAADSKRNIAEPSGAPWPYPSLIFEVKVKLEVELTKTGTGEGKLTTWQELSSGGKKNIYDASSINTWHGCMTRDAACSQLDKQSCVGLQMKVWCNVIRCVNKDTVKQSLEPNNQLFYIF